MRAAEEEHGDREERDDCQPANHPAYDWAGVRGCMRRIR